MLPHQRLIYPCPFCDRETLEVLWWPSHKSARTSRSAVPRRTTWRRESKGLVLLSEKCRVVRRELLSNVFNKFVLIMSLHSCFLESINCVAIDRLFFDKLESHITDNVHTIIQHLLVIFMKNRSIIPVYL